MNTNKADKTTTTLTDIFTGEVIEMTEVESIEAADNDLYSEWDEMELGGEG